MQVSGPADDRRRLVGREEHQRVLAGLISNARNGISGSMVIRGEPGIGKTALLQDARRPGRRRPACSVGRVRGRVGDPVLRAAASRHAPGRAPRRCPSGTSSPAGRGRRRGRAAARPVPGGSGGAGAPRRAGKVEPGGLRDRRRPAGSTRSRSTSSLRRPSARGRVGRAALRHARRPRTSRPAGRDPDLPLAGLEPSRPCGCCRRRCRNHRPAGGRADRRRHRRQPARPDRPGPGAVRSSSSPSRAWPTSRSRSVTTSRPLPAADPPTSRGRPALAAGRGRRLHRQRRPDRGPPASLGLPDEAGDEAEAAGLVELGQHRQVPASPGALGRLQRRPGRRPQAGPRARCRVRRGRSSVWSSWRPGSRQGDGRHRRGRRRPARAGRRPRPVGAAGSPPAREVLARAAELTPPGRR